MLYPLKSAIRPKHALLVKSIRQAHNISSNFTVVSTQGYLSL